jgi:hypothetical protein
MSKREFMNVHSKKVMMFIMEWTGYHDETSAMFCGELAICTLINCRGLVNHSFVRALTRWYWTRNNIALGKGKTSFLETLTL